MSATPLFHLAFPVRDLAEARRFFGELIGCSEGRSSEEWCDFNFYGHQIVAYQAPHLCAVSDTSPVIARSSLIGLSSASDRSEVIIVMPAEGPSFGVAPSGMCMCTSLSSKKALPLWYFAKILLAFV